MYCAVIVELALDTVIVAACDPLPRVIACTGAMASSTTMDAFVSMTSKFSSGTAPVDQFAASPQRPPAAPVQ